MIDLSPDDLERVRRILAAHVPDRDVWAFGSRVNGKAHPLSDLDLVILGAPPLERSTLMQLQEAFQESELPMRVDVLDWHRIAPSFQAVIERDYEILQGRTCP